MLFKHGTHLVSHSFWNCEVKPMVYLLLATVRIMLTFKESSEWWKRITTCKVITLYFKVAEAREREGVDINFDMATTATTARATTTTTTTTTAATTTWSTKNCLSFPFYFVSVSPSQWIHSTRVSIFICHKSPSVCSVPPPPFATPRLSRVARIKLGHNQFLKSQTTKMKKKHIRKENLKKLQKNQIS